MVEKTVRCPKCHEILSYSGQPGEIKKITCPMCGQHGRVTFKTAQKTFTDDNVAIEVNNLRKVYGELVAVNNISFRVKKGEIFAFLGPNGAGKTTTVEMIEYIRMPTAGAIKILGRDISNSFNQVKDKIGILPQEFKSFERLTVYETLDYFSKLFEHRADIDEIIRFLDLESQKKQLYRNLSGGLKQRVGVAISLVNDPEIVFLDEPSTGLDPKSRREVWNVIADLKSRGKTVFLTTHYMEEAEYLADHIAIIHKGSIIAEGSTEDLINQYGSGSTLRIKNCKTLDAYNILRDKGFNVENEHNGDISLKIDNKERVLEVLSQLRLECIEYESIDIRRSNLEEVFLHLTGSKLSEEET